MTDELDRIERDITIDAPVDRVWTLVAEPGWYINDNEWTEHRLEHDGDLTTVHDPVHGAFVFRTVTLDEPHYAAFRWLADHTDPDSPSTLVEFRLTALDTDTTELRVTETGFDSLPGDASERRTRFEENSRGWTTELEIAKHHLEKGGSVARR
ncbi:MULTISPECIES: SRPBCC family protein [Rhodococcus]|uniref:ATPase n=1 Tax=Rhodococcus TaxID=1827 RepID=UPI001E3A345C|nr:ATPase [Rhodococcus pyridinivorans]MCD2118407.1 ATPase [Rhodococcus pyridinivorans]MCZ4627280.1 ATPase [Rhodococcus pyridinivorans]MCZ4648582.1 ATPase [Rhodococcus pyridinivorans]MDJ0482779.1 ATPase [Rhodococcus pyridinivorans]MDV7254740.1 ATPase [Rhodococcus pyridinivorans]